MVRAIFLIFILLTIVPSYAQEKEYPIIRGTIEQGIAEFNTSYPLEGKYTFILNEMGSKKKFILAINRASEIMGEKVKSQLNSLDNERVHNNTRSMGEAAMGRPGSFGYGVIHWRNAPPRNETIIDNDVKGLKVELQYVKENNPKDEKAPYKIISIKKIK
jgi:hypothetical protein